MPENSHPKESAHPNLNLEVCDRLQLAF
jgi:hypothetical protein